MNTTTPTTALADLKFENTARGFALARFADLYGVACSIQKSSLATEDAIWFGVDDADPKIMASQAAAHNIDPGDGTGWVPFPIPREVSLNTRMHLTQELVRELLPILAHFAETGDVATPSSQIAEVAELPPPKYPQMRVLTYGEVSEVCGYTESQMRDAIAASRRAAPTATHGPLHLTNRKTADIAQRGYNIVGYVLRSEGGEEICISAESAVRWLPQAHYQRLMHEQDGSLFAPPAPASAGVAAPADQIDAAVLRKMLVELDVSPSKVAELRALFAAQPAEGAGQAAPAAEQPGAHHLTLENVVAVIKDLREIADGTTERSIYSRDWVVYSGVLALIIEWLAARRASPAPVSTEQAGDAWISVDDRLPEKECLAAYVTPNGKVRLIRAKYARKFQIEAEGDDCETEYNEDDDTFYIKAGWLECIDNWGEYSSCYVVEGVVTHWQHLPAAPSPNNSPVGADKEP